MIIFKYNLKKYFRTVSTWVFLALALAIVVLFTMIFTHDGLINSPNRSQSWKNDSIRAVINVYTLVAPFIIIVLALFASFKSVQLFRDEINEGSLLLIISKPISRKKLLIYKWLSLMTIFAIFIIPVLITQTSILLIFLKYKPTHHLILLGSLGELFVSIIFFCLFSSIALIISLRLGVKSVIGLSFAAIMLVVISNSIQTYTYKPQFTVLNSPNSGSRFDSDDDSGALTTEWNFKGNSSSKRSVPLVYSKISDKKPLFNKLWPLDLDYQISQITNLFLHSNKYNHLYNNGIDHIVKEKSAQHINFSDFSNSLFMTTMSTKNADSVINYFNNNQQDGQSINKYLAPAMKDAHTYLYNLLNTYMPTNQKTHKDYTINLNFSNFSAKYAKSAKLFTNIASNEITLKYLWDMAGSYHWDDHDTNNGFKPVNGNADTIAYDANTIFNTLLNYQITTAEANLIIKNKAYIFNLNAISNGNDNKNVHNNLTIESGGKNNSSFSKSLYYPWAYVGSFVKKLLDPYNQSQNITNDDNRIKFNYSADINTFNKYFYLVKHSNYANGYIIAFGYLGISIALIPLTYWWFSRSDFS